MSNNKDFKVKNGILPTSYQEGLGTVVSAVEGYYLSGASYDSVSFDFSSQFSYAFAFGFADGGTKMYGLQSFNGGTLYQYTLSTAYDISTASYANKNYSFANGESGFVITPDGSSLYISANDGDAVYRYTFGTAFDASTLSNGTQMFSTSSVDTQPDMCKFNNDGSKFFLLGRSNNRIYEYSVSTAYDLTTATYSNNSVLVSAQAAGPLGFDFSADGTSLVVSDNTTDSVYLYTLTTGYDLTTATYSGTNFSVSSQDSVPGGMSFIDNGSKLLILGRANSLIYQYSTSLATNSLDLSTGSVFDLTPTSDAQVTLSNPADSGTVSQATLLLGSEDSTGVGSAFSTTLYTGNGSTQTITNGIDLAGDGGMVWGKIRSAADHHWIVDSENGIGSNGTYNYLEPSLNTALRNFGDRSVKTFNSDGFTLANSTNDQFNLSSATYVSWTFKKQAKFFDIVTWTGNGTAGRTVSHNLGAVPGTIIVKSTSLVEPWAIYHRKMNGGVAPQNYHMRFTTGAESADSDIWNNTAPTGSVFTVGGNDKVNANSQTYVAYLFAHDTDASSIIKCGSFTADASGSALVGPDLGWEPQWVLLKNATSTASGNWWIFDSVRGFTTSGGGTAYLLADSNVQEYAFSGSTMNLTSNGFTMPSDAFAPGQTFIYMAIRNSSVPTVTYDPTLEWPNGTAPTSPAIGETDVITFNTSDGGTTYSAVQAIDGAK